MNVTPCASVIHATSIALWCNHVMATVTQSNSMEHSFIETKVVTQLINKVSAFCGNELDLRNFGSEDVKLSWLG